MRASVLLAIALLVLVAIAPAPASADPVPSGRIAIVLGLRDGTGRMRRDFGLAALYGVEAAWEPLDQGQPIGFVLNWSVLWANYGSDAAAITGELDTLEMNFGARVRMAPKTPTRTLFLGGGGSLLRATSPLPPDDKRAYVGGYVGAGGEALWHDFLLTVELRFGLIGSGPGAGSLLIGIGKGV